MTCFSESDHKARKQHQCFGCLQAIVKGEIYTRWVGMCDGDFSTSAYHKDCREFESKLNHENDPYYDDWYPLYELVSNGGREILDGAPEAVRARFPERKSA